MKMFIANTEHMLEKHLCFHDVFIKSFFVVFI